MPFCIVTIDIFVYWIILLIYTDYLKCSITYQKLLKAIKNTLKKKKIQYCLF